MDAVWSIVLFFGALAFAGVLLGGSLWFSQKDRDLAYFEARRQTDPAGFRNLVWVCRINCPLVFLMSLWGSVASLGLLFEMSIPWVVARVVMAACGAAIAVGFAYLSWRWTRWGWQTSLRAKQD